LTNKTIVAASNTITTAASGNLSSTELNTALAELQTDIDTRLTTATAASTYQPLDSDLTAVAGMSSNGLVTRTATGTMAARTLTAASSKVAVTNGDGVSGNPTVDVTEANLTHDNIGGTLGISKGGTGQTTANSALNALLPSQASASGKVLSSNGTDASWAAGLTSTLSSAHVFVGNGSNVATDVAVTGDISMSNTGVTALVLPAAVHAYINVSTTVTAGTTPVIKFDTERFDVGNQYDSASTGRFTATKTGYYLVSYGLRVDTGGTAPSSIAGTIQKNDAGTLVSIAVCRLSDLVASKSYHVADTAVVQLNATETVRVVLNSTGQDVTVDNGTSGQSVLNIIYLGS
jgi:hypothetical protein